MKITIEIRDEVAALIKTYLGREQDRGRTSHGPLTMKLLAAMLLEDVALAVRRPGSWEGANMDHVLRCHGYEP